jgi:DNA end-binding protein Ku
VNELTTPAFDATKYADEYADRVRAAVEQKVAGQELQAVGDVPKAQIIDLFEALKQSLALVQSAPAGTASKETPELEGHAPGEAPLKKAGPRASAPKKRATAG